MTTTRNRIASLLLTIAAATTQIDASAATGDTLTIRTAQEVLLVPDDLIDEATEGITTTIRLKGSTQTLTGVRIPTPRIDADFPRFRTFKFNDKYNDILFADAEGEVSDSTVVVDVTACIGKTLCPSFSLTHDDCTVYVDGQRHISHGSRLRFDRPVTYTIARPGYRIIHRDGDGYTSRPWGREVTVDVRFAVDRATSVPRIDITLDGGKRATSITKETYRTATISIDGGGVFPDLDATPVNIRGRGNSSWEQYDKKPYRIKFDSKQKPFGLKGGKNWCLLAQARTGTLLTNPIALRVASMIGTKGANHAIPVELYISGEYRGSYLFTENPGFSNNSIDLPDESNAYMLELDAYPDDQWLMYDDTYQLTVNVKEPNLDKYDYGDWNAYRTSIVTPFNRYTDAIRKARHDEYERMMDIDSWSRYMLVNDLVRNTEIGEPRSVKTYRVDRTNDDDKYIWGPVWDFDWAFGLPEKIYVDNAETDLYQTLGFNYAWNAQGFNPGTFFYDMLNNSDSLQAARYAVWTEFMTQHFDELLDYIDDYQRYAQSSFEHDKTLWKKEGVDHSAIAKAWLSKRASWVYSHMKRFPLPDPTYSLGDVDQDGRITSTDVSLLVNHLLGLPTGEFFTPSLADLNHDNQITISDLQLLLNLFVR